MKISASTEVSYDNESNSSDELFMKSDLHGMSEEFAISKARGR
jgi:hypothetical protein